MTPSLGHFMFFVMISEMRRPQDAMKAAWTLQSFATTYYTVFAAVTYTYIGSTVASPSFSSLPPLWQKASYGTALFNFWIAGSLYAHTASKLCFVRIFRNSKHLHTHTVTGWGTWTLLVLLFNTAAFVLAVGVPIFNYLIGTCRNAPKEAPTPVRCILLLMRCADQLLLICRTSSCIVCCMVHLRDCRDVLASRFVSRRRRVQDVETTLGSSNNRSSHCARRCLYMCGWAVCRH